MKKNSYQSSEDHVDIRGPHNDLVEQDTSTESGARGFNLIEMTSDFDSTNPEDVIYETQNAGLPNQVFDLLVSLGDELDQNQEESLANFADFLLKKFAEAESEIDYSVLFNNLMIKINNADLVNTNEIIKKLTKIYSRTFLLEYYKNQDKVKSQQSAYKKTLHRADQYLSEA